MKIPIDKYGILVYMLLFLDGTVCPGRENTLHL